MHLVQFHGHRVDCKPWSMFIENSVECMNREEEETNQPTDTQRQTHIATNKNRFFFM